MKYLILAQSINIRYGAARSLGHLIRNFGNDFDIIFQIPISINVRDILAKMTNLKEYVGNNCHKILFSNLPIDYSVVNNDKSIFQNKRSWILQYIKRISITISRYIFIKRINNKKYDYIYLNSLIYYDLIEPTHNYIIHVRELFYGSENEYDKVFNKLSMAKKIIFIDRSTYDRFKNLTNDVIVLNNPFDMSGVELLSCDNICNKYKLNPKNTIISILGLITPPKGVDTIITSVCNLERGDIYLLIAGSAPDKTYYNICKDIANTDQRIIFLGDVENVNEIYCISDYVIRGEMEFCIGRTVYEGLYSGCHAILPITDDKDKYKMFELHHYSSKIHYYFARDVDSLSQLLEQCKKISKSKTEIRSNVLEYVENFNEFINK